MTEKILISDRIISIVKHLNISINDFALQLGYNRSQVLYDILNLKSKPSYSFFEKLNASPFANIFSMEWLISGTGEMLKTNNEINAIVLQKEIISILAVNQAQQELIEMQKKEINRLERAINEN